MKDQAHLIEIFSSYQGEGIYAGVRQVFIRLAGCNIRCAYCDTPESWSFQKEYRVETPPESQRFETFINPVSAEDILKRVRAYSARFRYHSISITGGEPLVQTDFLESFLPELRPFGLPLYFETNGTMADKLERVIDLVDIVALDIKLPSCPGVRMTWEDTRRCVEVANRKEAFIKIVLSDDSREDEVDLAARLVREVNPSLPVVLQPVTPFHGVVGPTGVQITRFREVIQAHGLQTHIVPQLHKLAGWL